MKKSELFTDALYFRHACKIFEENKKISDEEMKYILEAGRMSPSSFGMEGWKFLVVTNTELKQKLQAFCWDQPQVTSCSHLVIILAAINPLKLESGIPQKRFQRRDMPQEMTERYIGVYKNFIDKKSDNEAIFAWSAKQTYIAATNMMAAAAMIGVDSCPMEGFEEENINEILKLDTNEFRTSLVLPFGYRVKAQPEHLRLDFDEVVEFIK